MQACNRLCNKIQKQAKKKSIQDDKMKKKQMLKLIIILKSADLWLFQLQKFCNVLTEQLFELVIQLGC